MHSTSHPAQRTAFRFTLRGLLLLVLVVSVFLGWRVDHAAKQKRAVMWLQQAGGKVTYNADLIRSERVVSVLFGREYCYDVIEVRLHNRNVTDISLLQNLTRLRRLELDGTSVSDLTPLAGLSELEYLDVRNTQVSELSPLVNSNSLKSLLLEGTPVTDISPLTRLSNLETLTLGDTAVKDVAGLAKSKRLRFVHLRGTQVSKVTIQQLRRVLPYCRIVN